jgi:hypothetical protein
VLVGAVSLAEELTSEQLLSSRQSLFFLLSHLANIGINYWAINKKVFGLNADQYIYSMPLGCIDVLNVLYRTMNRPNGAYTSSAGGVVANLYDNDVDTYCQQTSANGNISITYGSTDPIYVGSIGFIAVCSRWWVSYLVNCIYEYSDRRFVTWSTVG